MTELMAPLEQAAIGSHDTTVKGVPGYRARHQM